MTRWRVIAVGVAWMSIALPAVAMQKITGTIRGTVTDPAGGIIVGAEVTVINEETRLSRTTTTGADGGYVVPELPLGIYRVEASFQGFKKAVHTGVQLHVAGTAVVNIVLTPGAVVEEVTVEASPLIVETSKGEVSGLIQGVQVRELPLNGRSFVQLTTLMPGVAPADNFDTKNKGLFAAIDMSISGGATNGNLWTVDSVNNNDVGSNRTVLVFPSIDAIEEFRIHRNSYGAEFGQAGGAQVNIVTRSGGNEFHGSVYYFGRNDRLNATDYFLNLGGQKKAPLRRNDAGYTLGGPIIRDRAFFFWSQEWNRERRGVVNSALVPTAAEKTGDFTARFLSGCNPANPAARVPVDPSTRQPFPGNRIPADRISPAGRLILQLYPDANIAPSSSNPCPNPNWVAAISVPINWRQENVRADVHLSRSATVTVRYTQDSWDNGRTGGTVNGLWGDDPFPAVDSSWEQPAKSFVVKLVQTFGQKTVNDFQFSFSGNTILVNRGQGEQLMQRINAAIPTIFPVSGKTYGTERTHPTFWGADGYAALWHLAPWDNFQDLFIWKDDFSSVAGAHTFKAGFLYSFNRKDETTAQPDEAAQFWGPGAGLNGWGGGTTGNYLADLLLRDMTHGFSEARAARKVRIRWRDIEAYVGDDWRVRPRLTLNYGIRYSFLRQPYLADNRYAIFVPSLFSPALGADPCNGLLLPRGTNFCREQGFRGGSIADTRALVENDNNTIAPRFGLAWDPTGAGKMAIRFGIGQFFAREMLSPVLNTGAVNPPFNATVSGIRFLDSTRDCCGFAGSAGVPAFGIELAPLIPNTWQWNVTVERELWHNVKWEIGYVGNRGVHLLKRFDINQVLPGDRDRNGVDDRLDYVRASGDTARRANLRPFSVFGTDAAITLYSRPAGSSYHSLQTLVQGRFLRNSIFHVAYTFSKLISTSPELGAVFNNDFVFTDNTNFNLDRGPAQTHRPHIFTASLVYNLPSLDRAHQFVRGLFGDWELGVITAFSTGPALTVRQGATGGIAGGFSGTGSGFSRPNRVAGQPCRASGGPKHQWLNPRAFTYEGFELGKPGTAGVGICSGPGSNNWDISLMKNFRLTERVRIQFRWEMFNAFNHTQFRAVNTTLDANNIVLDSTDLATARRVLRSTPNPTFGTATLTRGPREIQYALKIIF